MSEYELPQLLYKFRSGSDLDLSTLARNKIFVPDFYNLNDIYESDFEFQLSYALSMINIYYPFLSKDQFGEPILAPVIFSTVLDGAELERHRENLAENIREKRHEIFSKGVYCLSRTNDSETMWGHYADSYKGYCIEYSIPSRDTLYKNGNIPFPVEYTETPPKIEWFLIKEYPERLLWYYMIGHKSRIWSYENEHRIIYPVGQKEYEIPFKIESIIFGPRMPLERRKKVIDIFNRTIKYRECKKGDDSYSLNIIDFES